MSRVISFKLCYMDTTDANTGPIAPSGPLKWPVKSCLPAPLGPSGRRQHDRRGWQINMERLKFNAGDQLCIDCTARFRFIGNCKLVSSVFLSFLAVLFDVSCYLLDVSVTLYLVVDLKGCTNRYTLNTIWLELNAGRPFQETANSTQHPVSALGFILRSPL